MLNKVPVYLWREMRILALNLDIDVHALAVRAFEELLARAKDTPTPSGD